MFVKVRYRRRRRRRVRIVTVVMKRRTVFEAEFANFFHWESGICRFMFEKISVIIAFPF